MSAPEKTRLYWKHDRRDGRQHCPNEWVAPETACSTCGRFRLPADGPRPSPSPRLIPSMPEGVYPHPIHTGVYGQRIHTRTLQGDRRNVYVDTQEAAWIDELRIPNLSAYLRSKLQEDVRRGSPLKVLRSELEAKREELRSLEQTFEGKALETEEALRLFEAAAKQARKVIAGSPRPVQTTLIGWIHNHPTGHKLRELLPADFSDQQLADVLLRWPESKTEVQVLVEAGP